MLAALYEELLVTMQRVCRSSLQKHVGEDFYSVALFTSGERAYVLDSLATLQGLERCARRYLAKPPFKERWGTLEIAMRNLKWSPADSPYHCEFDSEFAGVQHILDATWEQIGGIDGSSEEEYMSTCDAISDTCVEVLRSIRASGIFDAERVVFNVLMGDEDDESRLLTAERLNSERVVNWYRRELEIDEARLKALRTSGLN